MGLTFHEAITWGTPMTKKKKSQSIHTACSKLTQDESQGALHPITVNTAHEGHHQLHQEATLVTVPLIATLCAALRPSTTLWSRAHVELQCFLEAQLMRARKLKLSPHNTFRIWSIRHMKLRALESRNAQLKYVSRPFWAKMLIFYCS